MTHARIRLEPVATADYEERESRLATGTPQLLPTVSFGTRAAVLAGIVGVSCAALLLATESTAAPTFAHTLTTVALGGPINGLAQPMDTTCCG
jgi:hypothetical protein